MQTIKVCSFFEAFFKIIQVEIEMEIASEPGEPLITIEEEEEIVLMWNNGIRKGIRDLSVGAMENKKEDYDILEYYRSANHFQNLYAVFKKSSVLCLF